MTETDTGEENTRAFEGTTRRRLLTTLAGSVALGSLAGCATSSEGNTGSVAHSSTVFGHTFSSLSGQAQLNPWAANYPLGFHTLLFDPATVSTPRGGHHLTDLVDAVTIDGATVTVEYSDAFTWWNGKPVTARDQLVYHRINEFIITEPTDVTLVDEYTLRYELDRPLARQLVLSQIVDSPNTAAWLFEPWLERLEGATTRSARKDVIKRLRGWQVLFDEASEKGFGYGPYEFSEVSPNRLLLERFDGHPRSDELSIPRLWFPIAKGLQADGLLGRGALDGGRGLLEHRNEAPEYIEQLARYPTVGGTKLVLNWRNDHLAHRRVRRALLYALPIDDIVSTAEWGKPTTLQTGMTRPSEQRWLDNAVRNRLRRYPIKADVKRASKLMRAAGYDRSKDGRWHDADGNEVGLRLHTTLWDGWVSSAQLIKQSLNSFGFDVSVRQTSDASFLAVSRREEFDLLLWWTTGRPYIAYDLTDTTPASLGYGLTDPSSDTHGKPVNPSIPTPSGSRTIDLLREWRRIERPGPERETAAATSLFARWWNYDLPDILLATQVSGVWGNTRDFAWPPNDDRAYRTLGPVNRPEYHLLRTGAVRPSNGKKK